MCTSVALAFHTVISLRGAALESWTDDEIRMNFFLRVKGVLLQIHRVTVERPHISIQGGTERSQTVVARSVRLKFARQSPTLF